MHRFPKRLVAALASALVLLGLVPGAIAGAHAAGPRVAIIVGPVGHLTAEYRALADHAAAEARRATADVVTVYSPNATWPAVKAALRGASVVVYLGHGNGWPSRYTRELNPRSQDGLGLNPVAGVDDVAHQYFGEWHLANRVRLAPNAVVILSRLCYASGNSEPGLPEGSIATARQRIDNFAAGWLAAGAGAVLVDAFLPPAHYVRRVLAGASAARAWRDAPTFHDHVTTFPSERSPGATAWMDPTNPASGFYRSLVVAGHARPAIAARGVRAVDPGAVSPIVVLPPDPAPVPSAFDLGARPGVPSLSAMPLAGATVELALPVQLPAGTSLGDGYRLGVRWISLDPGVRGAPAVDDVEVVAGAGAGVAAAENPGAASALVVAESAASVVEVIPAASRGTLLAAPLVLPVAAGRYRLEVTVHDPDGVALPYPVQASIPALMVSVGGPGSAWVDAPSALAVAAGSLASIQVRVTNGEPTPWETPVRLVGRWVQIGAGAGVPAAAMTLDLAIPAVSAATEWLAGRVPSSPGTYVLVASVERPTPSGGIEVLGRPATIIVSVAAPPLLPAPLP